jgi:hypothetical protein
MLLSPNPFSFWLNLLDSDDFFVEYLLRVYRILNAQLSPLLLSGGEGVWYLPDATSLQVTKSGSDLVIAAGMGVAVHTDFGATILGQGLQDTIAFPGSDQLPCYVHAVGIFESGSGLMRSDARENNALTFEISEDEERNGTILLAEIDAEGVVIDRRTPSLIWQLAQGLVAVNADVAALAGRVSLLENPSTGGGTDTGGDNGSTGTTGWALTQTMWNSQVLRTQALEDEVKVIRGQLGTDSPLSIRLMGRSETLRAEHSRLSTSVVRLSPQAALRQQSGIVVPGLAGMHEYLPGNKRGKAVCIGGNLIVDGHTLR